MFIAAALQALILPPVPLSHWPCQLEGTQEMDWCVCVCVCVRACVSVSACMHGVCVCVCMSVSACMHGVCVCVCMSASMHAWCVCVCMMNVHAVRVTVLGVHST